MVVSLTLRGSKLSQSVSPTVPGFTELVVRTRNTERLVIPSTFLAGTRFIRVRGSRQSFSLSTLVYNQDIDVVQSSSISTLKGIGLSRSFTSTVSLSIAKAAFLLKVMSFVVVTVLGQSRGISKVLSAINNPTVTISALKTILKVLSAVINTALATIKSPSTNLNTSTSPSLNTGKAVSVIKNVSVSTSQALTRLIAISKNFIETVSVTLAKLIAKSLVFNVPTGVSRLIGQVFNKAISCLSASSLTINKGFFRSIDIVVAATRDTTKLISKFIQVNLTSAVGLIRALTLSKIISIAQLTSSSIIKTVGKLINLSASTLSWSSQGRSFIKDLNITIVSTAGIVKEMSKNVVVSIGTSCNKLFSVSKQLLVTGASTLGILRGASKTINITTSPTIAIFKQLSKAISIIFTPMPTITTLIGRLAVIITNIIYARERVTKLIKQALKRVVSGGSLENIVVKKPIDRIVARTQLVRRITYSIKDSSMESFTPKQADESQFFTFNFDEVLASSETIVSAVVTKANRAGFTTTNSGLLTISGAAIIDGGNVSQLITSGRAQDSYVLKCKITTSSNQVFDLFGRLDII